MSSHIFGSINKKGWHIRFSQVSNCPGIIYNLKYRTRNIVVSIYNNMWTTILCTITVNKEFAPIILLQEVTSNKIMGGFLRSKRSNYTSMVIHQVEFTLRGNRVECNYSHVSHVRVCDTFSRSVQLSNIRNSKFWVGIAYLGVIVAPMYRHV